MNKTQGEFTEIKTKSGIIRANLKSINYLKCFSKGFLFGSIITTPLSIAFNSEDRIPVHCAGLILIGAVTFATSSIKAKRLKKELFDLEKQEINNI